MVLVARKPPPGRWQRQKSQRVAGRGRVENHAVEGRRRVDIAEKPSELIEGRDLKGARTGKLFLHAGDGRIGQDAAIGADHAFSIFLGRDLRIDVESPQCRHTGNGGRMLTELRSQHFIEV